MREYPAASNPLDFIADAISLKSVELKFMPNLEVATRFASHEANVYHRNTRPDEFQRRWTQSGCLELISGAWLDNKCCHGMGPLTHSSSAIQVVVRGQPRYQAPESLHKLMPLGLWISTSPIQLRLSFLSAILSAEMLSSRSLPILTTYT